MNRLTAVVSAAGLCALWPLQANAQEKGPVGKGTFVLSAERLTGVFHSDASFDPGGSVGTTTIALFGMGATTPLGTGIGIMEVPRIGFDGFVIDGLSIGGTVAIFNASNDNGSETDFLVAPRVGYAYMFSGAIGIWPRGGLSYWHSSFSPNRGRDEADAHAFAFSLDCPLVIFPSRVLAITVGPLLDVSFGGRQTFYAGNGAVNQRVDFSVTQFGLSAGVAGFF
jgi:hypothetical protein